MACSAWPFDDDNLSGDVWILAYLLERGRVTNSFKWTVEEMENFAVGNSNALGRQFAEEYQEPVCLGIGGGR